MTSPLWIGLALAWVGLGLRLWALKCLMRAGLSEAQILCVKRPVAYTTEGPYLFLNHPAYWGSLVFLMGAGMAALGWGGAVLFAPAWPFFKSRMVAEDHLREIR